MERPSVVGATEGPNEDKTDPDGQSSSTFNCTTPRSILQEGDGIFLKFVGSADVAVTSIFVFGETETE